MLNVPFVVSYSFLYSSRAILS